MMMVPIVLGSIEDDVPIVLCANVILHQASCQFVPMEYVDRNLVTLPSSVAKGLMPANLLRCLMP